MKLKTLAVIDLLVFVFSAIVINIFVLKGYLNSVELILISIGITLVVSIIYELVLLHDTKIRSIEVLKERIGKDDLFILNLLTNDYPLLGKTIYLQCKRKAIYLLRKEGIIKSHKKV